MTRKWTTRWLSLTLVAGLVSARPLAAAPSSAIPLTSSGYTQNFDSLVLSGTGSVVPAGWAFAESGNNANALYAAGTGSSSTGDTYSFGSTGAAERAFGGVLSASLATSIGAEFQNNTGTVIADLVVTYQCEQWRLGTVDRGDRMDFQLSGDATSLTTGSWIDVDSLDCSSSVTTGPIGALNGNDSRNRTAVAALVTGLIISDGATFWLRWIDVNASGSDDGLSLDDFSVAPAVPGAVTLAEFTAEQVADAVLLTWETVSELDNRGFNLYRGVSAVGPDRRLNATLIPSQSQGSPGGFIYTWDDHADLVPGTTYFYWVEDVSLSGATTLHGPVSVDFAVPTAVTLGNVQAKPAARPALPLTGTLLALLAPLAGALALRRRRA